MPTPLLSLVMIVKDEATSIARTIASVRPFVDRYTILDTGSTDGTPALAREAFGDTPGEIHHERFVNYGATRSRALELADGTATFLFMLSGDESLVDGASLRGFCEAHASATGPQHGAYLINIHLGPIRYELARLTRSGAGWHYVGPTHEVLTHRDGLAPSIKVPGAAVVHDIEGRDPERKRRAWRRDLEILSSILDENPRDTRATFYLARTHADLGNWEQARTGFAARLELGGGAHLELYESLFGLAQCARRLGASWPDVQQRFLDAFAFDPRRAEPLLELAEHWLHHGSPALAHLYASRAAELPLPPDGVVFPAAYGAARDRVVGLAAAAVERWHEAELPLRRALAAAPDDPFVLRALKAAVENRTLPFAQPIPRPRSTLSPTRVLEKFQSVFGYFTVREGELLMMTCFDALSRSPADSTVVEVGSFFGRSTVVLAEVVRAVRPAAHVFAIDPFAGELHRVPGEPARDTWQAFQHTLHRFALEDCVIPVRQYSYEVTWRAPIAYLFIDGLHDLISVERDYQLFARYCTDEALIAFHDYDVTSPDVVRFVDRLIAGGELTVVERADSLIVTKRRRGASV